MTVPVHIRSPPRRCAWHELGASCLTSVSDSSHGSTDHGNVWTGSRHYQYCTSTANKEVINTNYIIKFVTWSINGKQCSLFQFIYQVLVCVSVWATELGVRPTTFRYSVFCQLDTHMYSHSAVT